MLSGKPASFSGYRIAFELQDEGPNLLVQNFSLATAREYVRTHDDPCCRLYVIAPDGRVVENETL
jgi:hypothetical protein